MSALLATGLFIAYRATCETAWTGDTQGTEWRLSWVVIRHEDIDGKTWAVYSDDSVSSDGVYLRNGEDGAGNGDHCESFDDFDAACRHADALAVQADERGF